MADDSTKDPEAPDHMFMFQARVKGYQIYMSRLKKGGTSGISDLFGSAEELFSDPVEVQPPPVLDLPASNPPPADEMRPRAIYLGRKTRAGTGDFLRDHLERCERGELGTATKKKALAFEDTKAFSAAVKELACVSLYLTAIEQELLKAEGHWAQSLIGGAISAVDKMLAGPPAETIMEKYDFFEIGKVCQKAASATGDRLGLGLVGDPAWNAVRKFLLGNGANRYQLLASTLSRTIEQLAEDLAHPG